MNATSTDPAKQTIIKLQSSRGVSVNAVFGDTELSSNGGALLIREIIRTTEIAQALAGAIEDCRSQPHITHSTEDLIAQRITQICLGYEDCNDCDFLRNDLAVKAAIDKIGDGNQLGSQPTMCRLENSITIKDAIRLFYAIIENWLGSYSKRPECIILDIDPTACHVYGQQELALYNTHYDGHVVMPFHVYDAITGSVVTTVMRPGKTPTAEEIISLLKRIVRKIRLRFPHIKIIVRGDSHHCKPAVLNWLRTNLVNYVLGLSTNSVLQNNAELVMADVKKIHAETLRESRRYHSFSYGAQTWSREERIVARVKMTYLGPDVRFIVTDMNGVSAKFLYESVYCSRGSAELMIKEHKCFLYSDRTSCNSALANQFRLMMHSAAYGVMHKLRQVSLCGTERATATFRTVRLTLLKIAVRIDMKKTVINFNFPKSTPSDIVQAFMKCVHWAAGRSLA